jgi:transcriptional regulator of arginine metabolism
MSGSRARRQKFIAEFIRSHEVAGQDEVMARLAKHGFAVTQGTVSRDLDQLGAQKVRRGGVSCYSLPDQLGAHGWTADRLSRLVVEWVQSVDLAGHLIVLKTPPGSAHLVAFAVDQARLPEIAGTVAGDDTLFIAVRDTEAAARLAVWLRNPPAE